MERDHFDTLSHLKHAKIQSRASVGQQVAIAGSHQKFKKTKACVTKPFGNATKTWLLLGGTAHTAFILLYINIHNNCAFLLLYIIAWTYIFWIDSVDCLIVWFVPTGLQF